MRPQLAWWVCRYWLIPQRCLSSHKTNKACLHVDQTGVATETGRGPHIYRNHMQMDRRHVVLLEQEGDRWMHVHTRESEFPRPFLFESGLISYNGYPFRHFIWIFTSDWGFGNVSPPHVFYADPLKAHYFTEGCVKGGPSLWTPCRRCINQTSHSGQGVTWHGSLSTWGFESKTHDPFS